MKFAIVLAAGTGSRMKSSVKKQFIEINGKPIITHTLKQFQDSNIDRIILVTGKEETGLCNSIINENRFTKVVSVVEGGAERYNSVFNGLLEINEIISGETKDGRERNIVLIHDGARPLISVELINECIKEMKTSNALIVGVKTKDTIKIIDDQGYVESTPDRNTLWAIQTPQAFEYKLIFDCYKRMYQDIEKGTVKPTDDAMVAEEYSDCKIQVLEGEYSNIKITTPDDILVAEKFLKKR